MELPEDRIIRAKTAFSRAALPEPFLVSLYRVIAPYRGCGHGCLYCDGRAEKYYVEGDFERDVRVRTNLVDLIEAEATAGFASREFGALCMGSGVTDIYQPLEGALSLTRRALEALIPTRLPIVILTKSELVLRDFDLLSQFPGVLLIVTVTTVDEGRAALLEPCASPPSRRLEVIRRAREAGFHAGVMAMPLCPGISDSRDSLSSLVGAAAEAGAEFVQPGGLTLRPGRQKDLFLGLLSRAFPELCPLYARIFGENRPSGMPLAEESRRRTREWDELLRERGMPQIIPHSVYRDLLSPPDALFVLFSHMAELYAIRGVDTRGLKEASGRYAQWLKAERSALRRKRIQPVASDPFPLTRALEERLRRLAGGEPPPLLPGDSPSALERLLGNRKLARFAKEILEGRTFDYTELSLI